MSDEKKEWEQGKIYVAAVYSVESEIYGCLSFSDEYTHVAITHVPTGISFGKFQILDAWRELDKEDKIKPLYLKRIRKAVEEIDQLKDWNFGSFGTGNIGGFNKEIKEILFKNLGEIFTKDDSDAKINQRESRDAIEFPQNKH